MANLFEFISSSIPSSSFHCHPAAESSASGLLLMAKRRHSPVASFTANRLNEGLTPHKWFERMQVVNDGFGVNCLWLLLLLDSMDVALLLKNMEDGQ